MAMAEYTEGIANDGAAILKGGHAMFAVDVVRDLNRKSFLEQNKLDMEKRLLYTIKNAARIAKAEYRRKPTWAFLAEAMGIGSGRAYEVCRELGLDPDAKATEF